MHRAGGLADRLRSVTQAVHTQAERSGFIADVLRRRASRAGYILFLRNLLPAYTVLESALEQQRLGSGPVATLARPELYRAAAIRSDLSALHGASWEADIPILQEGTFYAERVSEAAAKGNGEPLTGHAYTRYLGDLNGGQVLARALAVFPGLPSEGLTFFDFPGVARPRAFAAAYRLEIDRLAPLPPVMQQIEDAALASFGAAIALSCAVSRVAWVA